MVAKISAVRLVGMDADPFLTVWFTDRNYRQLLPDAGGFLERRRQAQRRDVERIRRRRRLVCNFKLRFLNHTALLLISGACIADGFWIISTARRDACPFRVQLIAGDFAA
jgi:hypothetical protein